MLDKLWVESIPEHALGQKVVQHKQLGTLPEVFEAFHEQWRQRWCRHDLVPNGRLSQILLVR